MILVPTIHREYPPENVAALTTRWESAAASRVRRVICQEEITTEMESVITPTDVPMIPTKHGRASVDVELLTTTQMATGL